MSESIKNLIAVNPNGLLQLQPAMTVAEYRENFGFDLKNAFAIYKSKKINYEDKDWFAFPGNSLKSLFTVQEETKGDLLVVFVVETIKNDRVYCHLILSDKAYEKILNDTSQYVLQVHQMYSKFWKDHIVLNMVG